ncbi:acyltransferase family protein [Marinicella rhabdoformis]|uniref:acyltransferase family protein n=1 Tax=Marinicella rhabdoformis TaxID=2580566 RepID=UPI0012AEC436|nr:acyltransferase [Marinicella rhabdoformis]
MNLRIKDSNVIKGWAIICIVIHNLVHNIRPLPSQNEFHFKRFKSEGLYHIILNDTGDSLRAIISFYGHYGVKLFIFLSAYGLAKKYLKRDINYPQFIIHHAGKLYKAFLLVVLFWFAFEYLVNNQTVAKIWDKNWYALTLKLLAINIPGYGLSPVGPWWFFAAIIQLYLIFPFLYKLSKKYGNSVLLIISVLAYSYIILSGKKIILYNAIGHLPEFCLGLYLANKEHFEIKKLHFLFFFLIFLLGHFYKIAWYFSGISIVFISLYTHSLISGLSKTSETIIAKVGKLSLYMFLINGFIRKPFIPWLKSLDSDLYILGFSIIYLFGIILLAKVISWCTKKPFQS